MMLSKRIQLALAIVEQLSQLFPSSVSRSFTANSFSSTLLGRAADWKLPKGEWDQCPDLLIGRDKWSPSYLLIHSVSFTLPLA